MAMPGIRWGWGQVALILMVSALVGACAPRRAVTPPGDVAPQAPARPAQAVKPGPGDAELLDLGLVEREIRKREAAVAAARGKRQELSGARQAVLDAWITAVEDQIGRMREVVREARGISTSADFQERARRHQRLTALLLEALSLSPLEPPLGGGPRVVEETRVSWGPMRSAFQRGDCSWLLQEYEAVARTHADVNTPLDVEVMRGICLGRAGRKQEALKILEPVVAQGLLMDGQQVRYLTANWLFEEGQLDKAADRYRSLLEAAQERERWGDLAKLRLEQIRMRKGEAGQAQKPAEAPPPQTPEAQEPQAPPLSFPQREPIPPPPAQAPPVAEKPPEAQPPPAPASSVQQPPAQPPAGGQEVQVARLQEAQRLMDAEKYEEAIETFQQVQGPAHEEQARKGIQEAQDRYAEKRRKEAADLVIKAREEDGAKRKANLLKALQILEETNRRYPNNRYAAKIQQNIQDLLGQIRAIDPSFRN